MNEDTRRGWFFLGMGIGMLVAIATIDAWMSARRRRGPHSMPVEVIVFEKGQTPFVQSHADA